MRGQVAGRMATRRRRRSRTALLYLHENLRQRLWVANKIREFSVRAQEALQRYDMYYNLGAFAVNASNTTRSLLVSAPVSSSSCHPPSYWDDDALVGISATVDNLEELLTTLHGEEHQKLRVVSIFGPGGVGKTTLANELYHKLGHRFQCRAFVRTSRKPDMRRFFITMLAQVRPDPDNWKVHSLISSIRTHLQDKRYLIIVDDLWSTSTWDIIKSALPDGNSGSRVLTTTEIEDLAMQSCDFNSKFVFKMKPLGKDDSRKLFFSSVFGSQRECPPEFRDVSEDIISKCGGLPLAIVTIASILTRHMNVHDQWDHVNKSLDCSLVTNHTWEEGMKQVINLSYNNLPQHLKACMMYLSIYHEDHIIWKDDLVNQWIAEGFIWETGGQYKQGIARAYFNELIIRKMIQPVDTDNNGEVLSCVVHNAVLNLIAAYKSIEENFVSVIHHSQTTTMLADKVRRLSLHFGNAEDAMPPTNMRLSQVRTFAYFGVFKCMPSIVRFRLLQVLILHLWGDKDSIRLNLTTISELFRLRYLKVTSNVTLELQSDMRGLQYLETIKIEARACAIQSDITHLPGLLHISLPAETNLPNGLGEMTSLRTLGYFDLSGNSVENLWNISNLTNLRDLQLTCSNIHSDDLDNKMQFIANSILERLANLESLTLVSTVSYADSPDGASTTSISGYHFSNASFAKLLTKLEFSPRICIFSYLPKYIGQLSKLCILKIGVRKVVRNDFDVLGGLSVLAVLSLYVHSKPAERIIIGKAGFPVLKYLKFKCCDSQLQFDADAMPNLRKLKLGFNASRADQQSAVVVGIEHLSALKEVIAVIGGVSAEEPDTRSAELAFRHTIRMHARLTVKCVNRIFGCKEDHSSAPGEECGSLKQSKIQEQVSGEHDEIMEDPEQEMVKHYSNSRFSLPEWHIMLLLRNKLDNQQDDITRGIPIIDPYSQDPWKLAETGTGDGDPLFYFRPLQEEERDGITSQAPSGYWKATSTTDYIYSTDKLSIGLKRTMEFYLGCAPVGIKTKWKMEEFIAFKKADAAATDAPLTPRSEMSLCQLIYIEPHGDSSAGSAGYGPARVLEEEQGDLKQYRIPSETSDIVENASGKNVNKQRSIRKSRRAFDDKPRRNVLMTNPNDDGYSWRKYGQKQLVGGGIRSYYRCMHRNSKGCMAKRQVQRADGDPPLFDVTYYGEHTCVQMAPSSSTDQSNFSDVASAPESTSAVLQMSCFPASPPNLGFDPYEERLKSDMDPDIWDLDVPKILSD